MKKNVIRIVAISLVAIMMCVALASCSNGPAGEYSGNGYSIAFKGSDVTLSWKGLTQTYEMTGEFEIVEKEDGTRSISFVWDEVEGDSILGDVAYAAAKALFDGTLSYNEGSDDNGNYIEIAGVKYYKD